MSLERLAQCAGIELTYTDAFGRPMQVARETLLAMLAALGYRTASDDDIAHELARVDAARSARRFRSTYAATVGTPLDVVVPELREGGYQLYDEVGASVDALDAPGYYDLYSDRGEHVHIIVAPPCAYRSLEFEHRGGWGVAAQLYSLRGNSSQGIGDFGTLAQLAATATPFGAWAIALNPLHQLNLAHPGSGSPYSPVSRQQLNALYIDVYAAARFLDVEVERFDDAIGPLVDYAAVAAYKSRAFSTLFAAFERIASESPDDARLRAFERFVDDAPQNVALAQAQAELEASGHDADYYLFLQWLAERQLAQAAVAAADMPVGLYRDLAVGVGIDSADVAVDPALYATGLSIGAPPDPLNELGQDWSLPPMHPGVLEARGYAPFAALLRSNMRHAGALRIDHVMSLQRLFCMPRGHRDGAYLRYDLDVMLAVCKVESQRAACMIVGEDLGTVPTGFRERMHAAGILSCSVLTFEREDGGAFRAPSAYQVEAVASAGTHDLPPLAGYLSASDIDTRERLGWLTADEAHAGREHRRENLEALKRALIAAGSDGGRLDDDVSWIAAVYRMLAATPSRLVLVQLEDVFAMREQVNVPGTLTEEPNWRRVLPVSVEDIASNQMVSTIASIMRGAGRSAREESA